MGPYAHKGNQWVGFDDVDTIKQKSEYVRDHGFGGGMIWALDLDDFNNMCGCEKYPLLKTINRVLRNYNRPDPHCTLDSNNIGYYESRQQDITINDGNRLYYLGTPASTYPLSLPQYLQRGRNIVPYLISPLSKNLISSQLKPLTYKYSHQSPSHYRPQHITSYPMVNHASPWAKILYRG